MASNGDRAPAPVLHHINLKTRRMDELIEWYGKTVHMRLQHKADGGAWMTNDAANHRIALLAVPGLSDDPQKIEHTGMHHMAFEFQNIDQLLDKYVELRDQGIVPHGCLDHGMTTSFYYADPDGNSLELQADNFGGDWAQSSEWMRTAPEFAADPIGMHVDPERLVAARDAGADAAELHRRGYAGEFKPDTPLDLRLPKAPAG
jgi:catechol-2,3-dioxygenase